MAVEARCGSVREGPGEEMAPVKVGEKLPEGVLQVFEGDKKVDVEMHKFAKGKKVILIGIPGAFTPVCSTRHIPEFVGMFPKFEKLVDAIAVISVNDAYVMREWAKTFPGAEGKVLFLADPAAEYTKKLGFEADLRKDGLGERSRRFSLMADDLTIKILHLEEGGGFIESSAEQLLKEITA